MIRAINIYTDRSTVVHELDPRTKIIAFVILSGMLLVFNDPRYVVAVVLLLFVLGALSRSLVNYARTKYLLLLLFLTSVIAWQFYIKGQVVARLGPITLTHQGILYGLSSGMRVASTVVLGTLFLSVTRIEELTVALVRLGIPHRIGFVISITARLVPLLTLTLGSIIQAQTARGLDITTRNPIQRVRRLFPVLVPFLVFSMRHASRLAMALEAKGFRPTGVRSYYWQPVMRHRDFVVIVSLVCLFACCVSLRIAGYGAVLPGRV